MVNLPIATLSDWLKDVAPVYQPMRRKTNGDSQARFFPRFKKVVHTLNEMLTIEPIGNSEKSEYLIILTFASLRKLYEIATNLDWFIALFAPAAIGRSNY